MKPLSQDISDITKTTKTLAAVQKKLTLRISISTQQRMLALLLIPFVGISLLMAWLSPSIPFDSRLMLTFCVPTLGEEIVIYIEYVLFGGLAVYHGVQLKDCRDGFGLARELLVFTLVFVVFGFLGVILTFMRYVLVSAVQGDVAYPVVLAGWVYVVVALAYLFRRGVYLPGTHLPVCVRHQEAKNRMLQHFSFEEMLRTTRGYQYFLRHCESEFAAENLQCWKAIDEFIRDTTPRNFVLIHETYIGKDAPLQVNVSSKQSEACREICDAVKINLLRDVMESQLFEGDIRLIQQAMIDVQMELFKLMGNDTLSRFKDSELFLMYMNRETLSGNASTLSGIAKDTRKITPTKERDRCSSIAKDTRKSTPTKERDSCSRTGNFIELSRPISFDLAHPSSDSNPRPSVEMMRSRKVTF